MQTGRVIALEADRYESARHFLSDRVDARQLAGGGRKLTVTVTRTGKFHDPRYGDFEITREMLLSMVRNFDAKVYGQEIVLDRSHHPADGAAGFFRRLFLDGNKLRAEVELTEYGAELITKRGFIYLSAEYAENFVSNEEPRRQFGATLLGAALTPRPVIKNLDPVSIALSEESEQDVPQLISERVIRLLSEEISTMKKLLAKLRKALEQKKLAEAHIKQLCEQFEQAGTPLSENEDALNTLYTTFENVGVQLAEQLGAAGTGGEQTIKLSFDGLQEALQGVTGGAGKGLDEEAVKRLLAEEREKAEAESRKLAETRDTKVKAFTDALDKAEGLEGLSADQRKQLDETAELITAETSDEQVQKLAQHAIKLGNEMVINSQLKSVGFEGPAGTTRITIDESNKIKALQEEVDKRLGIAGRSEAQRFAGTGGKLQEANKQLAEKVLEQYDSLHAPQLHAEAKMLAGGDGNVGDVSVPASFERAVIREALYNMVGLNFVNVDTLPFATSHFIPYSYRDTTAAGRNSTRVYEGGSIPRAGVIQTGETAYPLPQKIAFELSDEMRYLTAAGHLNWNALTENQQNASRIVGEDGEQLIFNEIVHSADEYGAVALGAAEDISASLDGANNTFVLAHFPVVRPRAVYDLQGSQVGATTNPIIVTYNDGGGAAQLSEYDGTGTQAAGTYYVINYNHGEIYLVSEAGVIQTPANTDTLTVQYSYATNVYAFDTDLGGDLTDAHWDKFLYRYGLRKSIIEDDRYHMANFGIMSGNLMTSIEQAKQFGANNQRAGTDLAADGNLGRVKDVPNFKTSAPGLWMGDQRCVIGERGITRYRMLKPWQMGELEDQRDANGRLTGKKEVYGDQFIMLLTPIPLKRAYTSIVIYSSSARVDRAA